MQTKTAQRLHNQHRVGQSDLSRYRLKLDIHQTFYTFFSLKIKACEIKI